MRKTKRLENEMVWAILTRKHLSIIRITKLKYYRHKSNTKEITQLVSAATEDMILAYFTKV